MASKPELPAAIPQDPENVKEQLALLREVSRRTGILHEAQLLQLQMWGMMVFSDVLEVGVVAFPEDPSTHKFIPSVELWVTKKGKKKESKLAKRLETLNIWCKNLLGSEVNVKVYLNKELIHDG